MAENKEEVIIRTRIGIVLTQLRAEVKAEQQTRKAAGKPFKQLNTSFGKLSSDTGLRAATLTNIFLGRTSAKTTSLALILSSLGKTFKDFAAIYDSMTDEQVTEHIATQKRSQPVTRKVTAKKAAKNTAKKTSKNK